MTVLGAVTVIGLAWEVLPELLTRAADAVFICTWAGRWNARFWDVPPWVLGAYAQWLLWRVT